MANDYASGQPVRTEADADERLQSKIIDYTDPSKGAEVSDGNLHVELHGNDPLNADKVVKLSEDGSVSVDGVYNVTLNTEPSSSGLVAQERNAAAAPERQNQQVTAVRGTTDATVVALDVALRDSSGEAIDASNPIAVDVAALTLSGGIDVNLFDEAGVAFSGANPLPVSISNASPGSGVVDFKESVSDISPDNEDDHTYTVPASKVFRLTRIQSSASGRSKFTVEVGPVGTLEKKFVGFGSSSYPNVHFNVDAEAVELSAGEVVKVTRKNRDKQAFCLYSSIIGELVDA